MEKFLEKRFTLYERVHNRINFGFCYDTPYSLVIIKRGVTFKPFCESLVIELQCIVYLTED